MAPTAGQVYVALVRAVNVGGRAKLPMADLRAFVEGIGGGEVRTYIQSGNVVFRHRLRSGDRVAAELEQALRLQAGLDTSVMVRTGKEMAAVLAANPYAGRPENLVHVAFFTSAPRPSAVADAALDRFAPEEAVVLGREAYLFLPNGVGRAKLPVALRRVNVPWTHRNWRTVTLLGQMADELDH